MTAYEGKTYKHLGEIVGFVSGNDGGTLAIIRNGKILFTRCISEIIVKDA